MTNTWRKIKINNGNIVEGEIPNISDFKIKDFEGAVEFIYHLIDTNLFKNPTNKFTPVEEDAFDFRDGTFIKPFPVIHFCRDFVRFEDYYKIRPYAPRNIQFLDSSIWQMIASDATELRERIKAIKSFYDKGYYDLLVAKENANLQVRLVKNAFIIGKKGTDTESSHAAAVSPFLFHSETKMKVLLDELVTNNEPLINKALKWRILLVDDHAEEKMTGSTLLNKKIILEHRLDEICKVIKKENQRETIFSIEYVTNIADAKIALCSKRYDIILLDYLLGEIDEMREYSYKLLEFIDNILKEQPTSKAQETDNKKWKKATGIYDRFWFFHISAFTYAIEERLQEKGFTYNTPYWNIARGADPTTTPELFKYNLFKFLLWQIEVITKLPVINTVNNHPITPVDLLELIFDKDKEKKTTRVKADTYFDALLKMKANYQILKDDYYYISALDEEKLKANESKNTVYADTRMIKKANGSPIVQSIFPDMDNYDNAFWEHLMHLVYLTAYGTIRQWPEMWEEFLFIKSNLENDMNDVKAGTKTANTKGEHVSVLIEQYIINLKGGSGS